MASADGKANLVVRYGSKPLEFAKGKNAIELASEAEVADTLRKVRDAVELGELDAVIEQQARFGRRVEKTFSVLGDLHTCYAHATEVV